MGSFIDRLLSLTSVIEDWILQVADAWWVHLIVYAFAALDGFFPSVPSESTIVTLSSLWSSSGQPAILLVGLAAWMGAWTGDNLGYLIGNKIGWERFRFLREGKGRKAVEAAEHGLNKRALVFLMTARYIPFGRTAVNLVAGAVHYPHRHFWPRSLLSTFVWAVYSCAIGAVAGAWFEDNHLLAITVALIAAVAMAIVVERVISAVHKWLDRRAERREAEEAAEQADGTSDPSADAKEPSGDVKPAAPAPAQAATATATAAGAPAAGAPAPEPATAGTTTAGTTTSPHSQDSAE
ncbi:DedA family protein [Brachybacterium aquaticum]|uniref:Membrane protein DedA with SNARE-associated domain n=1 Tax=Brachybacterium aquaticum TaxID=1432564 RepID=A0A841AF27_9MICO|nr:DedA family protein [Brachybacterium aquaticum]MBB5831734.1 membrane protein DedA with SNARE-associated domain [Brachybacterium aquaticum]